ncbi:hypothetical protein LR48_Vigan406s021400 [Vigna angularis]|nr:hypothetical protein LR48_Vigan406s021400 [Vigna angularis]
MEGDANLPISFFKIILKSNLQSTKIPNAFTAKYGGGLPNGTEWKVNWEKEKGYRLLHFSSLNQVILVRWHNKSVKSDVLEVPDNS